jgi:hypothetical protein
MMPHLGVLSTTYPEIAAEVFDKDCLVRLGTCISPVGPKARDGQPVIDYKLSMPSGKMEQGKAGYGQLLRFDLHVGERAHASLRPGPQYDLGLGKGQPVEMEIEGGLVGVIIDCRGRPLELPTSDTERVAKLIEWYRTMDVYDAAFVERYAAERPVGDAKGKSAEKGGRGGGLFARLRK